MKEYLLGGIDPGLFGAAFLAAMAGMLLVLFLGTNLRDPQSTGSPVKFSLSYLLSDNFKRIIANVLAVLIVLRFMPEITGWELSMFKGLCVGIASDSLALLIKQKTTLLDPAKKV